MPVAGFWVVITHKPTKTDRYFESVNCVQNKSQVPEIKTMLDVASQRYIINVTGRGIVLWLYDIIWRLSDLTVCKDPTARCGLERLLIEPEGA